MILLRVKTWVEPEAHGMTATARGSVWGGHCGRLSENCQFPVISNVGTREVAAPSRLVNELSQFAAQNFSRGRLGDDLHKMHFARLFVVSQPFADEGAQFFFHLLAVRKSVA